jgi:hypothetical protein
MNTVGFGDWADRAPLASSASSDMSTVRVIADSSLKAKGSSGSPNGGLVWNDDRIGKKV